jgi:hypothetical protein
MVPVGSHLLEAERQLDKLSRKSAFRPDQQKTWNK